MYFLSMEDFLCERERNTKRVFNTHLKDFQAVSNSEQPSFITCVTCTQGNQRVRLHKMHVDAGNWKQPRIARM